MIFIILAILTILIATINYKKGFLIYLLLQMIWFPDTQLFKVGGAWINLNFFCAAIFLILYVVKGKKYSKEKIAFPFSKPMACIGFSLLVTSFTSLAGFGNELVKAIGLIIMEIIIVYLIWKTVNTKEDYIFLFKGITIIVLFACAYIFYEKMTGTNFILDYKISCTSNKFDTYRDFAEWDHRGYRCYSIFDHTICASMVFSLYTALTFILLMNKRRYPFKYLSIITAVLCIPAMFFTQQRTGIFMLIIAVLSVVDFRKKKFWKLLGIMIVAFFIVSPYISENINLLLSIFNTKYQNSVSGSSMSLRLDQLDAIYHIMLKAPITGLGENFQSFYSGSFASRAMGYESLWFEQMAKHGLIGVLSYIFMIYYSVCKLPKEYKSKELFFVSLAYWITYTLTSTPYFRTYFLYSVIFYFIKNTEKYDKKVNCLLER